MRQTLSDIERSRLDQRIEETEKRTHTQIVLSLIQRSDNYEELPWKAFALGASISGLALIPLARWLYGWYPQFTCLITAAGILACGALLALLTIVCPPFARCLLPGHRAETEVRQYAKSLFLDRELFATKKRTGILVLVSLFERRVNIIPDTGLDLRLKEGHVHNIITEMTPLLKRKQVSRAFEAGLDCLSRMLTTAEPYGGDNELSNEIIEEDGV